MASQLDVLEGLNANLTNLMQVVRRSLVWVQSHRHGFGAGMVWRKDGIILTNRHVVNHQPPRVTMPDGSQYTAEVVKRDPEYDLALLRIQADDLPAVQPARKEDLKVGQLVFAIGHPWGQPGFVTAGVISSLGVAQTRGPRGSVPVLRTDAELAPGNSGGPLIGAAGLVLGINTLILGGDQGIAIPAYIADQFVTDAVGPLQHQETAAEMFV